MRIELIKKVKINTTDYNKCSEKDYVLRGKIGSSKFF